MLPAWEKRKNNSHKGQNGKVLVVGGSELYPGSPALVGISALRAGADLVYVAAPEKVAWAINALYPDLITIKLKGKKFLPKHVKDLLRFADKAHVVVLGNGLGKDAGAFVRACISRIKKPLVLDADAILPRMNMKGVLLTPHKKEFERLSEEKLTGNLKEDVRIVQKAAGKNVLLVKGKADIIANSEKYAFVKGGNPGMTKGGTGDVLAGLCAGLIAQGMVMFDAAVLASKINKAAGDGRAKKFGYSYLASELADDIKKIKKKWA